MKKRTEIELSQDRAKVCELLKKGYTSRAEIADIINHGRPLEKHVSDQQIRNDIEYMNNLYLEKGIDDLTFYKNKLEDELQLLKKIYYEGYELSRQNKISLESADVVIENEEEYEGLLINGTGNDGEEQGFQRVGKVREEKRTEGNPAFLQGVQGCIDRIMKLRGVDTAPKLQIDVKGAIDMVDVTQLMKDKMDTLANRNTEPKQLDDGIIKS